MDASIAAIRTSMNSCAGLLAQLGVLPEASAALERSMAELDELVAGQPRDGGHVH
jgi:hypothetical protein